MASKVTIVIEGDTPADAAAIANALLDNPKLDEIQGTINDVLAEIKRQGLDQSKINAVFDKVTANEQKLEGALNAGEPSDV